MKKPLRVSPPCVHPIGTCRIFRAVALTRNTAVNRAGKQIGRITLLGEEAIRMRHADYIA